MQDKTGIELLKIVRKDYPNTAVLLMTGYASMDTAMESVHLGAMDYLVKPISKEILLFNVNRCLEVNRINKNLDQINNTSHNCLTTIPEAHKLTKKEIGVYKHLISGMPNKVIAKELSVTVATVKFHLKNIYKKFGIRGRAGILKIISKNALE